jgi:Holliday junction resolvase RusA-like endonuclease
MPLWECSFFVEGDPRPKGNLLPMCPKACRGQMRPFLIETPSRKMAQKLREWTRALLAESRKHAPPSPLVGAVEIDLEFWIRRPKTVKRLYPGAACGDRDKLERAVFDALQVNVKKKENAGCVIVDDNQDVGGRVTRRFCDEDHPRPGVQITVRALEPQPMELF